MASRKQSQQGVALVVILLLLALMVSIAATMSERLYTKFHRTGNQLNYQQAYWYSLGVEVLAKVAVEQSYKDNNRAINLSQPWALEDQAYPLDYGEVEGRIVDKQACFNLNVLATVKPTMNNANENTENNSLYGSKPYLVGLLQQLLTSLDVDSYQAEIIADSTWEFIDTNVNVNSQNGVEDSWYASMQPIYVTANTFLADSSELRAVQSVTGDIMTKIEPYICTLPTNNWQLNINTVKPEQAKLLVAMFGSYLGESDIYTLLDERPFDGWDSVESFLTEPVMAALDSKVKDQVRMYLTVDSAYFELDARIFVDSAELRVRSLLFSNNRETVTVVSRRFGGISERVSERPTE